MVTDETKELIIDALYRGLDKSIEQSKPAPDYRPAKDIIYDIYHTAILGMYYQLIIGIEKGEMADIEAVMKAYDYTSHEKINQAYYIFRVSIP